MYRIDFLKEDRDKRKKIKILIFSLLILIFLGYFLVDLYFAQKELEALEEELELSNYSELEEGIRQFKEDLNLKEDESFSQLKNQKGQQLDFLSHKSYVDMAHRQELMLTSIESLEGETEIRGQAETRQGIFDYREKLREEEGDMTVRIASMDYRDETYEFTIKIYRTGQVDENE